MVRYDELMMFIIALSIASALPFHVASFIHVKELPLNAPIQNSTIADGAEYIFRPAMTNSRSLQSFSWEQKTSRVFDNPIDSHITVKKLGTLKKCKNKCKNKDDCHGFTYLKDVKRCSLYLYYPGPFVRIQPFDKNIVSGIKSTYSNTPSLTPSSSPTASSMKPSSLWYILDPVISYVEGASTIILQYETGASNTDTEVIIYQSNCMDSASNEEALVLSDKSIIDKSVSVELFLDKSKLNTNSEVLTFDGPPESPFSKGELSFCAELRLLALNGEVSVSSKQSVITMDFDTLEGEMSVTGVEVSEVTTDNVEITNEDHYGVLVCQCSMDSTNECLDPPRELEQNSKFFLCIQPSSSDVAISNFFLTIENENSEELTDLVVTGSEGPETGEVLTYLTGDGMTGYKLESRVFSKFFYNDNAFVTANGKANLYFTNAKNERASDASFSLQMSLETIEEGKSDSSWFTMLYSIFSTIFNAVVSTIFLYVDCPMG